MQCIVQTAFIHAHCTMHLNGVSEVTVKIFDHGLEQLFIQPIFILNCKCKMYSIVHSICVSLQIAGDLNNVLKVKSSRINLYLKIYDS